MIADLIRTLDVFAPVEALARGIHAEELSKLPMLTYSARKTPLGQ